IVIWAISAVTGYVITWGIPPVLSLVLSMVLYVIAGKLGLVRGVGVAKTSQVDESPADPSTANSLAGTN
ncbi:MAG: cytosine permease, partial [Mycetocola sp.]